MTQLKMKFSGIEIADFRGKLSRWYRSHHRKLPWRETKEPYKIWVSEVMLQQTTVAVVIPYFKRWLSIFPDLNALSKASQQKVLKAWEGLGYYQRAKNLHKTAQIIIQSYGGQFPQDYKVLRSMPGLGPSTTAALLCFAFDKPYPVVEANVRRVMMRLLSVHRKAQPKNDWTFLPFLNCCLPQQKPGQFNQALMELGALVCKPKNPLCSLCPVTEFCQAYKAGEQEIIPQPKKRKYQKVEAVVAIIKKDSKYLIQKRPSKGLLAGLWEFPGGKRRGSESLLQALQREIKEELGVEIENQEYLIRVNHAYTQFQVTLHVYACSLKNNPHLKAENLRWVTLRGFRRFPFPSGSAKIIRFLEERERKAVGTSLSRREALDTIKDFTQSLKLRKKI
jgi:A/G-specific adenine glycosylase